MIHPRCCGGTKCIETIWELDERGVKRTRILGEIVVCVKHQKPVGEIRRADTGRRISDAEWAMMGPARKFQPPYYFLKGEGGKLTPQGWPSAPGDGA